MNPAAVSAAKEYARIYDSWNKGKTTHDPLRLTDNIVGAHLGLRVRYTPMRWRAGKNFPSHFVLEALQKFNEAAKDAGWLARFIKRMKKQEEQKKTP